MHHIRNALILFKMHQIRATSSPFLCMVLLHEPTYLLLAHSVGSLHSHLLTATGLIEVLSSHYMPLQKCKHVHQNSYAYACISIYPPLYRYMCIIILATTITYQTTSLSKYPSIYSHMCPHLDENTVSQISPPEL